MGRRKKEPLTPYGKWFDALLGKIGLSVNDTTNDRPFYINLDPKHISLLRRNPNRRPEKKTVLTTIDYFVKKGVLDLSEAIGFFHDTTGLILTFEESQKIFPNLSKEKYLDEMGHYSSRGPTSTLLEESVWEFLSRIFKAVMYEGDKREEKEPSGILKKFITTYNIQDDGFYTQVWELEIFQLKSKQEIATPLYVDLKDEDFQVTWNGNNITSELSLSLHPNLFDVREEVKSYDHILLPPRVRIGETNTLYIKARSRLVLCNLNGNIFAACFPYFYAIEPIFSVKLPQKDLKVISIKHLKREPEKPSEWRMEEMSFEKIENFYQISVKDDNSIIKKRYCPDLVVLQFEKTGLNILANAVAFPKDKEKPLFIRNCFSFFCGIKGKPCPAKRSRMIS